MERLGKPRHGRKGRRLRRTGVSESNPMKSILGRAAGSFDVAQDDESSLQQSFEVRLPVKWSEIVELFAGADEAGGNSEVILDCYNNAGFAAAIEFGHDKASESKRVLKLACLAKRITARRRIDYQQGFVRRVRIEFAESAFYLLELGHQICFRVLATSGVAKQEIDLLLRCPLMRFVTKRRGICTVLAANYFNAESFCPDVELLDSRRAKRVCGREHDRMAFMHEITREFCGRCCFAGSVHADNQKHSRLVLCPA